MSDETDQRDQDAIDAARREVKGVDGSSPRAQAETRAPDPSSSPPPDSFAGYKIVREIHRGGQGVVYQAFQESTKRKVAIKVMKEGPFAGSADKARFEREVQILGQLKHPNIVTVYDSGTAAGSFFFVMDYISGQQLDVYMSRQEHSIDETLKLFAKICEAVNSAHLKGVIHRDLKPGNIRIDDEGEPHILDFGLAKVAVSDQEASMMTMTGQFIGSLPWSSPEQAEGKPGKIDVRTDVYSLGVMLYQMLTGKFPYEVIGNIRDVLDRIMKAEPARPSTIRRQINDEVETIVLKCLQKERERRYQAAGELGRDIRHFLAGEPIEAKRDSAWYVLRKQLSKYRTRTVIAAAFVLVVTAGIVISLTFRQEAKKASARLEEIEREVDILTEAQGKVHRDTLERQNEKAELLTELGRYVEAEKEFKDTLETRIGALGEEHPLTVKTMKGLIALYRMVGRDDEGDELDAKVLKIKRQLLASTPPSIGHKFHPSLRGKAVSDLREMELYYELLVEAAENIYGADDWRTALHRRGWGTCLAARGKYDEAEPQLLAAYEGLAAAQGPDDLSTRNAMRNAIRRLVDLYGWWHETEPGQGHDGKTAEWRAKLAAVSESPSKPPREGGDQDKQP